MNRPQIKICGLTDVDEAVKCVNAGADAIGLVFFKKSPRNVSEELASEISQALPGETPTVGVFVNESFEYIMDKVSKCGLKAVQLHGNEPPELVEKFRIENIHVIKAFYMENEPSVYDSGLYNASSVLVECAKGILPGGNALSWNFGKVKDLQTDKPLIIAGGLSPSNIYDAIKSATPDVVDVSSGVESAPGKKDINKVETFIKIVSTCKIDKNLRRIF